MWRVRDEKMKPSRPFFPCILCNVIYDSDFNFKHLAGWTGAPSGVRCLQTALCRSKLRIFLSLLTFCPDIETNMRPGIWKMHGASTGIGLLIKQPLARTTFTRLNRQFLSQKEFEIESQLQNSLKIYSFALGGFYWCTELMLQIVQADLSSVLLSVVISASRPSPSPLAQAVVVTSLGSD